MKDTAHHLRHVQKKVIQSSRKAQAAEDKLREKESIVPVIESEVSHLHKKKQLNGELRKSLMRMHVH